MYRVYRKIVFGVLSMLFLANMTLAIQNDYKNTLLRVNLEKIGENSYNINLFTQSNFSEPVKIIKKSDLNYYILLPETKNSVTNVLSNSKEIRSVTVNSYKYAGADVNNGYVKVNINTVKPLYFNIYTKLNTQANAKNKTTVASLQPKIEKQEPLKQNVSKAEKKNSVLENKKITKTVEPKAIETKKDNSLEEEKTKKNHQNEVPDVLQTEKFLEQDFIPTELETQSNQTSEEYLEENLDEIMKLASEKKSFLYVFKNKLVNKLARYNLELSDFILMSFVAVISFFGMFIFLRRKQKNVRLEKRKELIKKTDTPLVPKEDKQKNDGQYFVFDNSVKQTGLLEPTTQDEPKKYELSSYEPELNEEYKMKTYDDYTSQNSEYDIIQKVLKEETINKYSSEDLVLKKEPVSKKTVKKQKPVNNVASNKKPIKKTKPEPIDEKYSEPIVLSQVEIAPERGFMCVSYNDNINLVGYIFDDVFPLYNFKRAKLENYEIRYRMSDKDANIAHFIVKVDKTKVLISVSNESMNFEIML